MNSFLRKNANLGTKFQKLVGEGVAVGPGEPLHTSLSPPLLAKTVSGPFPACRKAAESAVPGLRSLPEAL